MKILHIPTAIAYEWTIGRYAQRFDMIGLNEYIFIDTDATDKEFAEWSLVNEGRASNLLKSYPNNHRPKYEFIVVEE